MLGARRSAGTAVGSRPKLNTVSTRAVNTAADRTAVRVRNSSTRPLRATTPAPSSSSAIGHGGPQGGARTGRFARTVGGQDGGEGGPTHPTARARRAPGAHPPGGGISPASTFRSVVFPAPFGPKIASVCPGTRRNDTSSSATTRPNAWRNPSAKSIDTGGQVLQVERLDEIARVPQVEHVDQRFHADVGGGPDDRERGLRLADLLQQRHAIGIGESEVQHQDFGVEFLQLAAGLRAPGAQGA